MEVRAGVCLGGDYVLVDRLSEGGMGAVWIAEQQSTGTRRAVKLMHRELVTDERARERFVQEARVSGRIRSDHVVQVIAAGVDDGTPWLAMELLEGQTLAEWLAARSVATREETSLVFVELCHALAAAHALGIVHRDLKPENVFLATSRRPGVAFSVKVLDFGIAKLVADAQSRTTQAIGTPAWMAPEQTMSDARIDPSTDVWALGLIAFRMLVGASYWRATRAADANAMALLREVALEPLPIASARAAEIGAPAPPDGFDEWFARCVVREASARFETARTAHDALQRVLGFERTLETPSLRPSPSDLESAPTAPFAATLTQDPLATAPAQRSVRRPLIAYGVVLALSLVGAGAWVRSRAAHPEPLVPSPSTTALTTTNASASALATATVSAALPATITSTSAGWIHASCPDGMRKVPGGSFKLGTKSAVATVKPFCLDEFEVSVARYSYCIEKGLCPAGARTVQSPVMDEKDVATWSRLCNFGHPERVDHPLNCVDFHAAKAYCASVRARLPSEEEWEWAARGGDEARSYPWGELLPPAPGKKLMCWARETGTLGTCRVGAYPDGNSRWMSSDLSGNVREWTDSPFDDEPEKRVFRGGCFGVQDPAQARVDARSGMLPENRLHNVGFRCAATLSGP